jgi:hypothetical protein
MILRRISKADFSLEVSARPFRFRDAVCMLVNFRLRLTLVRSIHLSPLLLLYAAATSFHSLFARGKHSATTDSNRSFSAAL